MTISGLYVFSGTVTNNKLNQIIRFCYVLTGFALVGSLLPFALPGLYSEPGVSYSSEAPLGVLRGCANAANNDRAKFYPEEVLCQSGGIQWVARVGGTVGGLATSSGPPAVGREIIGGLVVPLVAQLSVAKF